MDPPYGAGLAAPALAALDAVGWIAADALVAVETGHGDAWEPPTGFRQAEQRRYGRAVINFLRRE